MGNQRNIRSILIAPTLFMLAACGGSGGGSSPTTPTTPTTPIGPSTDLSVIFVKGSVAGASCSIFEISDQGVIGATALATATTNAAGVADFSDVPYEGAALVSCSGGLYVDEATGASLEPSDMRAVIDTDENISPVITPLTEIAVQSAVADAGGILTALDTYNMDNSLGIDVTAVVPTNLQTDAAADDAAGDYAILLAVISQVAANADSDTPQELADLIEDFVQGNLADQDIADALEDLANSDSSAAANISESLLEGVVDDLDLEVPVNFGGLASISGIAQAGETLTASLFDTNGTASSTLTYQWLSGDSEIALANEASYLLRDSEVGEVVRVTISYTDEDGFSEFVTSAATTSVIEGTVIAINIPGVASLSGSAEIGQNLMAEIADANGINSANPSYQWSADGTDIPGAVGSSYQVTANEVGQVVRVSLSYRDDDGFAESLSADSAIVNAIGNVSISGSAVVGEVLSLFLIDSNGITSASPTYQWLADGSPIVSANSSTYQLTASELGQAISVTLSYTDDDGISELLTSSETAGVTAADSGGGNGAGWGNEDSVPLVNCDTVVSTLSALEDGAEDLTAGQTLCLADGTYTGTLDIDITGVGTLENPVTVAAENPGSAILSGESTIQMSGEYVVFQGFVFQGGETRNSDLIQTRTSDTDSCNYCRITEISIVDIDYGNFEDSGKWLNLYGQYNRIDHNWFAGKAERSVMLSINREAPDSGAENTEIDYFQIDHNYFGDRAPTDGKAYADNSDNDYEAIRTGTSDSHAYDSFSVIENNYFERIDGEAEVISNKAGNNIIRNNTVRDSYGSITTRHGSSATIANNFMIGDGHPFAAGLRIIDDGHRVINNYVEGARYLATNFHGGIIIHNSDGSTSNGYQDVENILVAHNTVVNSVNSLNFRGGNEDDSPDNIYFVNNLFEDAIGPLIRNGDEALPTNSTYAGNYYDASDLSDEDDLSSATGFTPFDPQLVADASGIFRPGLTASASLTAAMVDIGSFDAVEEDMDGQLRSGSTVSGADEDVVGAIVYGVLSRTDVGPISYTPRESQGYVVRVPVANFDFEEGATGWMITSPAAVTSEADEVFAGSGTVKIDGAAGRVEQVLGIEANTNYTLSAFTEGPIELGSDLAGTESVTASNNSSYRFATHSFNSGSNTSVTVFAKLAGDITNSVDVSDHDFTDFGGSSNDDWTATEGAGIGDVQSSSNSASGSDGSVKFIWDNHSGGSPTITQFMDNIPALTDFTLSAYVLDKSDTTASVTIGVYDGATTNVLASQEVLYADLESADAPEGDDSFLQTSFDFNSGVNTSLTLFVIYNSNTSNGAELRVDDIELTYLGAPASGSEAFADEIRLVSYPGTN